jgi:hypothetical protein
METDGWPGRSSKEVAHWDGGSGLETSPPSSSSCATADMAQLTIRLCPAATTGFNFG